MQKQSNTDIRLNGLTKGEEESLETCLSELHPILERRFLFGGREVIKAIELETRLKNRLSPEAAGELAKEACEFIAQFAPHVEAVRRRTIQREAEQAAADAEHKAKRDARAAEVRRAMHEAAERKRGAA